MTDTASPIAAMLDALREHGWECKHPRNFCHPVVDGKPYRSRVLTGDLWHFKDAAVYLTDAGTIMLMGDLYTAWKKDLEFDEFIRWLKLPEPVWSVSAPGKSVRGQRDLFRDEE